MVYTQIFQRCKRWIILVFLWPWVATGATKGRGGAPGKCQVEWIGGTTAQSGEYWCSLPVERLWSIYTDQYCSVPPARPPATRLPDVCPQSNTDVYDGRDVQNKTAVTAYFSSKQLLLFVFELQDSLLPSSTGMLTAVQRQTAVTAVCLWAAGFSSAIAYWHADRWAKTNSSNCLLFK